jgi:hypothetical protein
MVVKRKEEKCTLRMSGEGSGLARVKEVDAPSQFVIASLSNTLAVLHSPYYIWPFPYNSGLLHDTALVQYNGIVSSRPFVSSCLEYVRKSYFVSGVSSGRPRGAFA